MKDYAQFDGTTYLVEWFPGGTVPPGVRVTQVSAVCVTGDRQVVLVSADGESWGLPGGHPEPGESVEETLRREIREEACCTVERSEYLGYQRCTPEGGGAPDYQLRYKCLVKPMEFLPKHEIRHRKLVPPGEFLGSLAWGKSPIVAELARLSRIHD
ncbi:MAG: NUDIX hydrolase [Candidatus Coatesbacteria bacterium]